MRRICVSLVPTLSLSLPLTASGELRGDSVRNYFDNLLPDNADIRERLRQRYRLPSTEVFDLLQALGRDCVGALQLLPPDQEPQGWRSIHCERLDEAPPHESLDETPPVRVWMRRLP